MIIIRKLVEGRTTDGMLAGVVTMASADADQAYLDQSVMLAVRRLEIDYPGITDITVTELRSMDEDE